jgi:RNA polymerase-binding transcription factor DksA
MAKKGNKETEHLEKVRYSDEELQMFKELITEKLEAAKLEYQQLKSAVTALVRIENKTYGICRETGKLIPKERLMLVPHATLSVEAKKKRD